MTETQPSTLTVKRTHTADPNDLDGCRYSVTTADGREYEVAKEFYAAGPSLFTWVLRGGPGEGELRDFNTKKAALRYIESLPTPSGP